MSLSKKYLEEEDYPEAPDAAFTDPHSREVDDAWLAGAPEGQQVAAMCDWFHARYWDPANETPYVSAEGGYIWVYGGPYDASEELQERFDQIVPFDTIEKTVKEVQKDGIYDWAPTQLTYYDESQDVFVDERNDPTRRLQQRLDELLAILDLEGNEAAIDAARKLVYAGVVSALETFLWETMAYWVDEDPATVENIIRKVPAFRDRTMKLGVIFDMHEKLQTEVRSHMQKMVWHQWEKVIPFMKQGLGIDLPSVAQFIDPTKKRHDIVHRSGQDVDGQSVLVSVEEVSALTQEVQKFADDLDARIAQSKGTPESDEF